MKGLQVFLGATLVLACGAGQSMAQVKVKDANPADEQELIARWKSELKTHWKLEEPREKSDSDRFAQARLAEVRAYRESVAARIREFEVGKTITMDRFFEAHRRLLDAELLVAKTKEQRIAALETCWITAKKIEAKNEARLKDLPVNQQLFANSYQLALWRFGVEFALVTAMKE